MCLGVPAQIKKIIDADNQIALVDLSGVSREINIACVLNKDYQWGGLLIIQFPGKVSLSLLEFSWLASDL
jgi:hydrogenase maturation factor